MSIGPFVEQALWEAALGRFLVRVFWRVLFLTSSRK